ncbi:MAG TPA: RluA family pseudouridine synthase [Thermodesulfobacteriota bacterium]|nr:RluA family pseudouridine synthase [Thermodesulfobacteriota bacterium]
MAEPFPLSGRSYRYKVPGSDVRKRLDLFLIEQNLPYSRSQLQKGIDEGRITVDGEKPKSSYRVKEGDLISVTIEDPAPPNLTPEDIPVPILYEDHDLLVINKPAGLVVHPAPGNYAGTLVHALLFHCRDLSGIGGVLRPGIVHRLDKDTSGLMVVAKNDPAHQRLIHYFQQGKILKEYQTLVFGDPPLNQGRMEGPIGRHPVQRKKMAINPVHGKPALTEWQVLERLPKGITWLQLTLKTGRTHQIRVHLASQGWPVIGDPLYGRKKFGSLLGDDDLSGVIMKAKRQYLHSRRLAFQHPSTGAPMDFSSELPDDMSELILTLKSLTPEKKEGQNGLFKQPVKNP